MKKVFALIAIVGFVACNNAETKPTGPDTASQTYKDSVAKATAPVVDTTKKVAADTTKKADTTKPVAAPAKK